MVESTTQQRTGGLIGLPSAQHWTARTRTNQSASTNTNATSELLRRHVTVSSVKSESSSLQRHHSQLIPVKHVPGRSFVRTKSAVLATPPVHVNSVFGFSTPTTALQQVEIKDELYDQLGALKSIVQIPARPLTRQASTENAVAQNHAVQVISDSVEQGLDSVDLSHCQLFELPEDIEALRFMVHQDKQGIASAQLKLFLSFNHLVSLPESLFRLDHLVALSLRHNQLTHLPDAILQLVNLQELHLGGNQLHYLPGCMKRMKSLQVLSCYPNPFIGEEEALQLNTIHSDCEKKRKCHVCDKTLMAPFMTQCRANETVCGETVTLLWQFCDAQCATVFTQ